MKNIAPFSENTFRSITDEIGERSYRIVEKDDQMPGGVFKATFDYNYYKFVFACTSTTASDFNIVLKTQKGENILGEYYVAGGEQVLNVRLLREDRSGGSIIYKSYDQMFFPTDKGAFRLSRKDTPDHHVPDNYTGLANVAGIGGLANAYRLPDER